MARKLKFGPISNPFEDPEIRSKYVPKPGDLVRITDGTLVSVEAIVRNVYKDETISCILDRNTDPEILDIFTVDPSDGLVHYTVPKGQYEVYGRVGGVN